MDGQERSTCAEPPAAAGPRVSKSVSKSTWLKRKVLVGAALLTVSVSAPQPSRAGGDVTRDAAAAGSMWYVYVFVCARVCVCVCVRVCVVCC